MKKIIYIILVVCFLDINSLAKEVPKATELEMFLFKIGFTSLLEDFKVEKNSTKANTMDIKKLKANVEYILQEMNKNKLEENSDITVVNNNTELLEEIEKLKDELNQLKLSLKNKSIKEQKNKLNMSKVTIKVESANIRNAPFISAKVVRQLSYGSAVNIESCNEYGWCKFQGLDEYIAKFLLKGL